MNDADAFYNDNDAFVCAWLRELIADGLLPAGVVDERSITNVRPEDCRPTSHFFAGIGGWPYALELAGWPDDRPVWTASCPCQPLSCAGKRAGHADERHLWPALYALIAQCRPPVIVGEQVASTDGREWLAGVRADLEAAGYAVGAADLCAAGVGAPHIRQRLYWVAVAQHTQRRAVGIDGSDGCNGADGGWAQAYGESGTCGEVRGLAESAGARWPETGRRPEIDAGRQSESRCPLGGLGYADSERRQQISRSASSHEGTDGREQNSDHLIAGSGPWIHSRPIYCRDGRWRRIPLEPAFQPLASGVSSGRVGILRGAGNSIVPPLAAQFVKAVMEVLNERR